MKPQKTLMQKVKILDQIKMISTLGIPTSQLLGKRVQLKRSYLRFSCPTIKYS